MAATVSVTETTGDCHAIAPHPLTAAERCQIYAFRKSGFSQAAIARELTRNRGQRGDRPQQAERLASERRQAASATPRRWTPAIADRIEADLAKGWSPEPIAGRARREGRPMVGRQRIDAHIRADKRAGGTLWRHRRPDAPIWGKRPNCQGSTSMGGRHAGRGHIPGRIDIAERPAVVAHKARVGDWEADTIIGKGHRGALVSLGTRATTFTLLARVERKTAAAVGASLQALLKPDAPTAVPTSTAGAARNSPAMGRWRRPSMPASASPSPITRGPPVRMGWGPQRAHQRPRAGRPAPTL